ncbi:hypothetical protein PMAYCL1PPCAC_13447 [Pristionchus mayeri]|uniref:MIF4G domain-containing protein n=1 Tax=Pristionchus mayeri TaxID=1317129 RepID=A0AAN4ZL25_9BILA|nr:hypothetical protein PMAYCL1PPCAC_13447 [Pristionchus mayeri]
MIASESSEKKRKILIKKRIEEARTEFRIRKFGNITFTGHLYIAKLIPIQIILFCVFDLLKSISKDASGTITAGIIDELSIECATRLLETIGKVLHEERMLGNSIDANFPMDLVFQTLENAKSLVSSRLRFLIMNLVDLRTNDWIPRRREELPKTLAEIREEMRKEQSER